MSYGLNGWTIVVAWMIACVLLLVLVWLLPAALRRRRGSILGENVRKLRETGELDPEEYRLLLAVLRDAGHEESAGH